MSAHVFLELILGLTVFLGITYRIRKSKETRFGHYAPDILIGILLIFNAASSSVQPGSYVLFTEFESGLIITIFLPLACSLAVNRRDRSRLSGKPVLWLSSGLVVLAFHLLSSHELLTYSFDVRFSVLAVLLLLGLSVFTFHGPERALLLLCASTWVLHQVVGSAAAVSGLMLIMGSVSFLRSGLLRGGGKFREFGFDSDDLIEACPKPFLVLDLSGRVVVANDEFLRISGFKIGDLIDREAIDLFDFQNNQRQHSLKHDVSKEIRCRLKRADGSSRQVLLTLTEILKRGRRLENLLCLITDEEEHELMKARIKAEARRFSSLYETSRALSTSLEIEDVLEAIATAAETLTDSDTCTIFTLDRSAHMIRPLFSTEKEFKEQVMDFEFSVGKGLTGIVVQDGKPRIENWDDGSGGAVLVPGTSEEEEESLLSVPLLARNEVIGALTLYKLRKKRFSDEQISTLTVFASQASAAIETSRLYMRLKESERIYKNSVNLAADNIFFIDVETGKIKDANEMALKIFGYQRSELASMRIWELCPKSHMQYARRLWQKAASDGQGSLSETVCEVKDESFIPVSINASRIEAGDVKFIQWVVRDISEYRNLLDNMQFFRNLVSDLAEPILVTEPTGVISYFNEAFEKFFSVELRNAEGSTINALSVGNRDLALLDSMRARLKGKEHIAEEIEFRREKSAGIRKVVSIIPIYHKASNVKYYIWLFSPPVGRPIKETVRAV